MALQIFQRLYSTNFTWPILEDFNPYNAFIRPHLDYGDKVYDRALANHPIKALSLFNIANASTVAIKGTSSVRFFFKNNSWKPKNQNTGRENCLLYELIEEKPLTFSN